MISNQLERHSTLFELFLRRFSRPPTRSRRLRDGVLLKTRLLSLKLYSTFRTETPVISGPLSWRNLSALAGSLVPLLPFFFLNVGSSIWLSILLAALTLFVVGVYKARVTIGRPLRSGIQMAVIGTISALAGYVVGLIFKVPTVP